MFYVSFHPKFPILYTLLHVSLLGADGKTIEEVLVFVRKDIADHFGLDERITGKLQEAVCFVCAEAAESRFNLLLSVSGPEHTARSWH